ncbi:MAG: DUF1801 domain-containing protein [Nocardioidaceae bacterium]|nr:DUF1801 domain-containing protein [Nocardioidaceae bacterium]
MAAAGIVTADAGVFTEMVAASAPTVRDLALAARALIFDVEPRTVEVVWPRQRTAGYGTGAKKLTEQFCWLAPYKQHVTFGFFYGSELPDPSGILAPAQHVPGARHPMRHVKITRPEQLDSEALRAMVKVATTHRVPPLPPRDN